MRIACSKPKCQYKIYILYAKFIVCQGEMLWRNLYREVEESERGRYFGCDKGNPLWPGGIKAESSLRWENHPQGRVSLENRRISTRPSEVKMCSQRWRSDNEAWVTGFYSACYRKFMEPFEKSGDMTELILFKRNNSGCCLENRLQAARMEAGR